MITQSILPRCPEEGQGLSRHSWIMSAANVCAHRGIPREDAHNLIAEMLTRLPNPSHEIEDAITKAYYEASTRQRSGTPTRFGLRAQDTQRITQARERMSWPPLAAPSQSRVGSLAESLGISTESVEIAAGCGLLRTAACGLVVTDPSRRCALRLPERSFLPGSERGWPVGLPDDSSAVVLVAGADGLLSAVHLLWCAGLTGIVNPAAVLDDGVPIVEDALSLLAGRRVRIFRRCIVNWPAQLLSAGADVDCYSFAGLLRSDGQPVRTLATSSVSMSINGKRRGPTSTVRFTLTCSVMSTRITTPTCGSALISRTQRIINTAQCETCMIDTFVEETISGQWRDPIDQIRAAQSKDEANTLKRESLGVFLLSGVFTERAKDKLTAHSGFLCCDFDDVSDPVALRDKLAKDKHTYFACLSPSGKGVKALVRIHPSAEQHPASFAAAQRYFLETYGVKLDASCKDVSRACFACHDPDAITNPEAELLEWDVFGRNGDSAKEEQPQPAAAAAVWPRDSVIEDFVVLARRCSESEDQILVGSFLPVVSAVLARNVFIDFGGRKYPNLYNILVAKPGLRKSTTVQLVTHIARNLLPKETFIFGVTSNQALFLEYLAHPDKLWLIDEGNVILANWAHDAAGKQVAKQVLTLYDCSPLRESYIKHRKEEGKAVQEVAQTSTSILIGTTFSSARFSALETRDGMRRRFNYYVSESFGRVIEWPLCYNSYELIEFIRSLQALRDLKGEMRLSSQARDAWDALQRKNRRQIEEVSGIDSASETYSSVLASIPDKVLRRAMVFEVYSLAQGQGEGLARYPSRHP